MHGVVALLPADDAVQFGQLGLDGGLELVQFGVLAGAQRTQGREGHVHHLEQRLGILEAGRGAQLVDAVGEGGHHMLPALAFGSRDPGVLEAALVDAQHGQELLEHFQPAAGIVVAGGIVAVTRVAARHQHTVRTVEQGAHDEQRVDAARTGDTDDTQGGGLGGTGDPGGGGTAVGTPVAKKAYDPQFFAIQHWHKAFTSARI